MSTTTHVASVVVGHNIRAWTRFTIADLTDTERAALEHDDHSAAILLILMDKARRLEEDGTDYEKDAEPFAEYAVPSVISVTYEEEA